MKFGGEICEGYLLTWMSMERLLEIQNMRKEKKTKNRDQSEEMRTHEKTNGNFSSECNWKKRLLSSVSR